MGREAARGTRGFTLIEVLIVISIICLLSSLSVAGAIYAKQRARQSCAKAFVFTLASAVERYREDLGEYPGAKGAEEGNAFPALFEALWGELPPRGGGGPSAPYMELHREDVVVRDGEGFRAASREEIEDAAVPKYIADPWGNPYVYRENRSRVHTRSMVRRGTFDLYSIGQDGIDQTTAAEKGDDIGAW